jgi:3-oxoacyl-[acyl-carrier-protein] synthase-3
MAIRSILAGVGAYLPERAVSNDELARTVETSDEWIRERTGIRQRYLAAPHETAAFMATAAARGALADAGAGPAEVDAIILATSTPDQAFPATALRVQAALGVTTGFGFDIAAACAGIAISCRQRRSAPARSARGISSEVLAHSNWQDRGHLVAVRRWRGRGFLRAGKGSASSTVAFSPTCAQGALGDILLSMARWGVQPPIW